MRPVIRARSRTSGEGSQSRSPSGMASDSMGAAGGSDGSHRIVAGGPAAVFAGGGREAAGELGAQVRGLDHGVYHQLRGQVQDVDLLGVLPPQLLGAAS